MPPRSIGSSTYNIFFLRIDRLRGRVLIRLHEDAEPQWVVVPSRVALHTDVELDYETKIERVRREHEAERLQIERIEHEQERERHPDG